MQESKKIVFGQFFTKENVWLKDHIKDFVKKTKTCVAYDPFAGGGDLLRTAQALGYKKIVGLDIDPELDWEINDSLLSIPHLENAIIITNPPYISSYSATRKKVNQGLLKYFNNSVYDDVYLIALDKMLESADYVVAIIPETFINSNYRNKHRLHSITILEDNPFSDTDTPVIVACFDKEEKSFDKISIYKNDKYVNTLKAIEQMRLVPKNNVDVCFNDKNGWLAVRCVDSTNPDNMLRFDFKENIDYDWENGIKVSSRLLTLVEIDVAENKRKDFIAFCNDILNNIRLESEDVILSPFKGNMKNGIRRRRLDFFTCRAIIEKAYNKMFGIKIKGFFDED